MSRQIHGPIFLLLVSSHHGQDEIYPGHLCLEIIMAVVVQLYLLHLPPSIYSSSHSQVSHEIQAKTTLIMPATQENSTTSPPLGAGAASGEDKAAPTSPTSDVQKAGEPKVESDSQKGAKVLLKSKVKAIVEQLEKGAIANSKK